jgi:hypothetical protein
MRSRLRKKWQQSLNAMKTMNTWPICFQNILFVLIGGYLSASSGIIILSRKTQPVIQDPH